ncbi:MAG: macro domain-containing protein [Bdellovibrionales bacterium]|nr:macro domain-containing protein [Bdellovibrionales bacterium]
MIQEVTGDITLSKAEIVAHGIAANDPMNQGLALQLHERYPAMHKDFHHWCRVSHPKPGAVWLWSGSEGAKVANLITQDGGYADHKKPGLASVSNVDHALKELAKLIEKESVETVALPKIATGVGGLAWEDVKPLIEERLGKLDCKVFLYSTFQQGVQAQEA